MTTQSDIAKALGISQTAVSLVFNNPQTKAVSAEKKDEILRLGRRSQKPGILRGTQNVGYIIPAANRESSSSYYHRFFVSVQEAARAAGRNVIVEMTNTSLPPWLLWRKVAGVIIQAHLPEAEIRKCAEYCPIILLNQSFEELFCDVVMPDNREGMRKAFSYLVQNGHQRIALFGLSIAGRNVHFDERVEGYRLALKKHELPLRSEYLCLPQAVEFTADEIHQFAREVLNSWITLAEPPTAAICINDDYAAALVQAALALGMRIPGDLSVVGYSNFEICTQIIPALTSVNQPMKDMGAACVELLLSRIKAGAPMASRKVVLAPELIVRDSTASVPGLPGHGPVSRTGCQ
jgi:LacI family transcriptional regulator